MYSHKTYSIGHYFMRIKNMLKEHPKFLHLWRLTQSFVWRVSLSLQKCSAFVTFNNNCHSKFKSSMAIYFLNFMFKLVCVSMQSQTLRKNVLNCCFGKAKLQAVSRDQTQHDGLKPVPGQFWLIFPVSLIWLYRQIVM